MGLCVCVCAEGGGAGGTIKPWTMVMDGLRGPPPSEAGHGPTLTIESRWNYVSLTRPWLDFSRWRRPRLSWGWSLRSQQGTADKSTIKKNTEQIIVFLSGIREGHWSNEEQINFRRLAFRVLLFSEQDHKSDWLFTFSTHYSLTREEKLVSYFKMRTTVTNLNTRSSCKLIPTFSNKVISNCK